MNLQSYARPDGRRGPPCRRTGGAEDHRCQHSARNPTFALSGDFERSQDITPITLAETVTSAYPPRLAPVSQELKHEPRLVEAEPAR